MLTLLTPFLDQIVTALIAFTLGGGFWKFMQARAESRARNAEATSIGAKTGPEVADISLSTLVKVNQQLTVDYERMRAERDDYCSKFETLRDEVIQLQDQLDKAQADLRAAHEATSALRDQLETLMEAMPAPGEGDVLTADSTPEGRENSRTHPREGDFHNPKG